MIEKNKQLLPNARDLRKNMTEQERRLWYQFLKEYPVKIYKQKIIDSFIVDFYCDKAKMAIEIDGSQHFEPEDMEYDRERTRKIEKQGIVVIRFSNREVNQEFGSVCEKIHLTIKERIGYDPYETK